MRIEEFMYERDGQERLLIKLFIDFNKGSNTDDRHFLYGAMAMIRNEPAVSTPFIVEILT